MPEDRGAWPTVRRVVKGLTTDRTRSWAKDALSAWQMLKPVTPSFTYRNREGLSAFDVTLPGRVRGEGVSAMLRVRNEESRIWDCLESILYAFDEIVVVDNASTDSTEALLTRFKEERDDQDVIRRFSYPFEIARLGRENARTDEDSVHSVSYYYNWCLSKCRLAYVCKWDADMFLLQEGREGLRDFLRGLSAWHLDLGVLWIQTAYRDRAGRWFLARDEYNSEPMAWPNRATLRFHKVDLYETLGWPPYARFREWPPVHPPAFIYELKDTGEDEFSHWSPEDRENFPTERKQRELRNFESVRKGVVSAERFVELDPTILSSRP